MEKTRSERQNLKFVIAYSYCSEKVMGKFLSRLDKAASFVLLLTGMSVIATSWNSVILGSIVAVVTAWQLVYSPGQKAQAAKDAQQLYYSLYQNFDNMSDEDLKSSVHALQKDDTDEIGILSHPARLSALAMLGMVPPDFEAERGLKRLEWAAAAFAGELPEYHHQ